MSVPPNPRTIADLDVPREELERELRVLRAHAEQHLAERGEQPTSAHFTQWHEFLDLDPDLRGRDYSNPANPRSTT